MAGQGIRRREVLRILRTAAAAAQFPGFSKGSFESRQWPNGLSQLLGQPSFPDHVADCTIAWMPRWQNLQDPREEKFIRGYSVYPDGGCTELPWFANELDGFGSSFQREIKRRHPSPVSFEIQAPSTAVGCELYGSGSRGEGAFRKFLWHACTSNGMKTY